MYLVRFSERRSNHVAVGVLDQDMVSPLPVDSTDELLTTSYAVIHEIVRSKTQPAVPVNDVVLLPPIDGRTEVWAAGITYERSREARTEESELPEVYERLYNASRPELFFKAVPWRVVTDGQDIGIRRDSALNVPEAELAIMVNSYAEIVGYAVANDVSSRTIEAENPLYLPQAKIYAGSCALGPHIRPAWELDPMNLTISVSVSRNGATVWADRTHTSQLRRSPAELVEWLFREMTFPSGVVVLTGTGMVPSLDFTLAHDDLVTIDIEDIGSLRNSVVAGQAVDPTIVGGGIDSIV